MTLTFDPKILLQGFIFGVVISSVCTLIPSLKSAFVEPVEALRR
jgi:putative ABC transport system permease protein